MALPWKEVEQKPEFQQLTPEQKNQAQEQYFNEVVAPNAGDQVEAARNQFFSAYNYSQPAEKEEPGFFGRIANALTGSDRQTEETKSLSEVTGAPELGGIKNLTIEGLSEFYDLGVTPQAFKAAAGMLTTSDPKKQMQIIKSNYPEATFRQDQSGNVIVGLRSGEYLLNAPGISTSDVTRFAAQAGAFTPAGKATTIPGAALAAGATEAAIQSSGIATGAEDVDPAEIAIAAGLGGLGRGVEDIVSAVSRYRRGAIPEESRKIIEAGEEAGVPVMTTDVIEPETLAGRLARSTGEAIPVAGTGAQRASQQKARTELVEGVTEGITPRYDDIVASLRQKTQGVRRAAGERLSVIGNQMDEVGQIQANKTLDAIDSVISDLTMAGRVTDDATVSTLQQYKEAIEQGQTFKTLDTLRSDFREAVKGERQSLPSRSQAASEKIYRAMTDDIEDSITSNLGKEQANRFKQAKSVYARELNSLKKARLKNVLDKGDVTPESVKNILFSQKPSEQQVLYRSLTNDGRSAARMTILNDVIEKASRRAGGLTPNSFVTELKKRSGQIDTFFKGEQRDQIKGLQRLLDATRRGQEASIATPTGQSLLGVLGVGGAVADLGATLASGATLGTMARVYESAPVRNALLRLANTPAGSDARDVALREASEIVRSSLQALSDTNSQSKVELQDTQQ